MSDSAEKAPSDRKRSSRPRKPSSKPRRERADRAPAAAAPAAEVAPAVDEAPREPRPPRKPSVPVPEHMLGKTATGVVLTVIKKGRFNFGFILIGEGEAAPSIYFNPSNLVDNKVFLRRGYEVEFTCGKDEEGRFVAQEIKLTAAGEKTKAENDAAYQARRAERLAAGEAPRPAREPREPKAESTPREPREPRERTRKPRTPAAEGTPLTLRATCQGFAEEKVLNVHNLISIGRLKGVATTAFEAPIGFHVYYVPSDGSDMVFLTKAVLTSLANNDKIHLAEPKET